MVSKPAAFLKPLVLVIDDEKDIVRLLQYNLEKEGYQVLKAETGEQGFELAKAKLPSLILLDLMLPGVDGLEVCKLLKIEPCTRHIPIVMLTAKNTDVDQVVGLEIGAFDYIAKPFSVKVVLARVKNILRRERAVHESGAVIRLGEAVLDKDKQSFSLQGKPVTLTRLEFRILTYLMEHPGKVFTREQLLNGAWGGEAFVVDRTVDVHVKSIRKKLGKRRDLIETVRGSGYRCYTP